MCVLVGEGRGAGGGVGRWCWHLCTVLLGPLLKKYEVLISRWRPESKLLLTDGSDFGSCDLMMLY